MNAARELTEAVVVTRPRTTYGICPWCGRPCIGRACQSHRDLVLIERALYSQSNETAASLDPGAATVSQPKGV